VKLLFYRRLRLSPIILFDKTKPKNIRRITIEDKQCNPLNTQFSALIVQKGVISPERH